MKRYILASALMLLGASPLCADDWKHESGGGRDGWHKWQEERFKHQEKLWEAEKKFLEKERKRAEKAWEQRRKADEKYWKEREKWVERRRPPFADDGQYYDDERYYARRPIHRDGRFFYEEPRYFDEGRYEYRPMTTCSIHTTAVSISPRRRRCTTKTCQFTGRTESSPDCTVSASSPSCPEP